MSKKYLIKLPETEREYLLEFIAQEEIGTALHSTTPTVQRVRQRYVEGGLTRALKVKPHAARAKKFDGHH